MGSVAFVKSLSVCLVLLVLLGLLPLCARLFWTVRETPPASWYESPQRKVLAFGAARRKANTHCF